MKNASLTKTKSIAKILTIPYLVSLSFVALFSIATFMNLGALIKEEKQNSTLINISGRQRRFSQTIAFLCLRLVVEKNLSEQSTVKELLSKVVKDMEDSHKALTQSTGEFDLPKGMSPGRRKIYFELPYRLDEEVKVYLMHAKQILKTPSSGLTVTNPDIEYIKTNALDGILKKLDLAVKQCEQDSQNAVHKIQLVASMFLISILFILLTEALIVVFPIGKVLQSQVEELSDQASLLNLTKDGILMRGLNGSILFWNEGAEKMYGYKAEQASGKISHELLKTEFTVPLSEIEDSVFQKGYWEGELNQTTAENQIVCVSSRWSLKKNKKNQPVGILEVDTDMTATKEAEKVVEEFYSVTSHELRTPLTSIKGFLSLLLGGRLGDISDRAKKMAKVGLDEADRLIRLTNAVLDMNKIKVGKMELQRTEVTPKDLIDETLNRVTNFAAQYEVSLESEIIDNNVICVDQDRLIQVLTNLISNAVKFSDAGQNVIINARKIDNCIRFSITDRGPGIDQRNVAKLFRMFGQINPTNQRGGTGIGLAVCKSIVEQHGGAIGLDSELSKGSTFWFQIPIA